ncbi:MAG: hypothetical protein ABSE04_03785 [Candidatus Microgenomates bacterium]|jgi:hypothetical protein
MRKEVYWAIAIGILFGLAVAFGAWRINYSLKSKTPAPTPTPGIQNTNTSSITLDKPENNDVVTVTPLTVTGITKPLSWVTVSGEKGDYITQSDETGVFSQDVDLTPGANQIKVTSLDSQGNESSQKVLVVYSASFQLTPSSSPVPTSATSESEINQEVAQQVAEASKNPKAYIGTVTDIADSTIQIKSTDSQIQQISISAPGIGVVNLKGTNNNQIKLTDIAIGDFIIAMGYVNSNSVLDAQRILVTDPLAQAQINASVAEVAGISKKTITVTDIKSGTQSTLTPDKNTDIESYTNGKERGLKIASINQNDLVIIVLDQSGTPVILRSVFDIGASQG